MVDVTLIPALSEERATVSVLHYIARHQIFNFNNSLLSKKTRTLDERDVRISK